MRIIIIFFFFLVTLRLVTSQTVSIFYVNNEFASQNCLIDAYETWFGSGNVNIAFMDMTDTLDNFDVVYMNSYNGSQVPVYFLNKLVDFFNNGGHIILATEGRTYEGGGRFMSSLFNTLSGYSITETAANASGTGSPPRFHNSNGPWGLSPHANLSNSTTTYANFGNVPYMHAIHQRNSSPPTCGNIQAINAVYPAKPNVGDGTLYIQGECWYPFGGVMGSCPTGNTWAHAVALARMHHALLTGNQTLVNQLNTWQANFIGETDFLPNDTVVCQGNFQPFSITAPPYTAYTWTDLSGNILGNSASLLIADSGTYIVNTVGTFPVCDGIDTFRVTINAIPTAQFTANNECLGNSVTFNNISTITYGSIDTYLWDFGDGNTSNDINPQNNYTTSGSYNVSLFVSNMGCSNTYSSTVQVFPNPIADAGSNQVICIGQAANFTASGGTSYMWNNGSTTPNINVSPTATSTYTVTVTDANGCSATDSVVLTVNPLPQAFAGNDTSICLGTDALLNASGGISYLWAPASGLNAVNISNPLASPSITTTYSVSVTDMNGCLNTDNVVVTVWNLPPANAGNNTSLCDGDSLLLTASGGITYNWNTGEQTASIHIAPHITSTYIVTATDINGCSASDDVVVTVNYPPLANAGNDTNICYGTSANLNASGGTSYQWSPTTALSQTNNANPVASPITPITYTVTVTNTFGCSATDDVAIGIYPAPDIKFSALPINGCEPLLVNFSDSTTPAIQSWLWSFGDVNSNTNTSTFANPSHIYNSAGLYSVSLSVVTTNGCQGTHIETNMIEVFPNPTAHFIMNPSVTTLDDALIFFEDASLLANTWSWNFGDPLSGSNNTSSSPNCTHYYTEDGNYNVTLVIETINGCIDSTSSEVIIKPLYTLYIPNAFSPNGDGLNDVFQAYGTNFKDYHMMIFNRWGDMLYETTDYNSPWNGFDIKNGEALMTGVYVYKIITIDNINRKRSYVGHITLMR